MKGLVYEDPIVRASWAPRGTNAYYVGGAPKHYRCMRFFMPATQQHRIADTWRLYPSHCATPTISPDDVTILAVCDELRTLNGTIPAMSHDAVALQTVIHNLCGTVTPTIPSDDAAPRVGVAPSPRVPRATRDARVLRSTLSNNAAPPVLDPRGATTSRARIRGT